MDGVVIVLDPNRLPVAEEQIEWSPYPEKWNSH